MSAAAADVLVVGGGVIGCAVAWELAGRGLAVTVVERGTPAREASWAAAGMLSPLGEARRPGPFLELSLASFRRFGGFAAALREATGIDVEHRETGKLRIALDESDSAALHEQHAWQSREGFGVELLDAAGVRALEPALAPGVAAGLLMPRDQLVDSRRLGRALWIAAVRRGVSFRLGDPATRVLLRGPAAAAHGPAEARAAGAALAGGTTVAADTVVLAAGCWSGQIGGLPIPPPVFPVGGQMIAVRAVPPPVARVILTADCYVIPRLDGRLLVGATVERAGFDARATAGGVHTLLSAALTALPPLRDTVLVESWAGLRPGSPDDLPILGPDPLVHGLVHATGHFRNGILLAPITAQIVADLVTGKEPPIAIEAFSIGRFAGNGGERWERGDRP